jgi:hypothetical protein
MRRLIAGLALGTTALVGTAPVALAEGTDPAPAPIERLELRCRKGIVVVDVDDTTVRRPIIGCRWTPSQAEDFAAYKLVRRVDEQPRLPILRTDDQDRTRFVDRRVRRHHTYAYVLVAVDADGTVIGRSNKVVVTT